MFLGLGHEYFKINKRNYMHSQDFHKYIQIMANGYKLLTI